MTGQVTPEQAYEALGHVNELLMKAEEALAGLAVSPVRVNWLRTAVTETRRLAQEHHKAAEILLTQPLADTFPNGEQAPNTLTYKQIFYLAALEMPSHRQTREMVGLPASRTCGRLTADDEKCMGSSMVFAHEPTCHAHATPAERERNRKLKAQWNLNHPDYQI